jgi:hypothetical protein
LLDIAPYDIALHPDARLAASVGVSSFVEVC